MITDNLSGAKGNTQLSAITWLSLDSNMNDMDDMEPTSTSIPALLVLTSPLPYGLHFHQTPPPTELPNMSVDNTTNSDNVEGPEVITSTAADTACNALVSVPDMRAGTPKPPSRPGSVLAQGLPWSLPSTCPPSRAATPLISTVNNLQSFQDHQPH